MSRRERREAAYRRWIAARAALERAKVNAVTDVVHLLQLRQDEADTAREVCLWRRLAAPQSVTRWRVRYVPTTGDGRPVERVLPPVDVIELRRAWRRGHRVESIEWSELPGTPPDYEP